MSTAEPCYSTPDDARLRVEILPFDRIPNQSRLFLDYLRDPTSLKEFYPSAIRYHHELPARQSDVLAKYETDRHALCDVLKELNEGFGAGAETLANIERLREADCAAVVSGQQAGAFTGPLYTVYKALTAVKLSSCLSQRGTKSVPVFWIATEDHDFPEVATAEFISRECRLASVSLPNELHEDGQPVGLVKLDDSATFLVEQLLAELPNSEFIPELASELHQGWQPGRTLGESFARTMTTLLGKYGLVLFDPLHPRLKQMAAPLYAEAAARAPEIASAIEARSRRLEEVGYHAQVVATENSFPLFLHDAEGRRHALARTPNGTYRTKAVDEEYTAEALALRAANEPQSFSPNVTLRAVVQDYLLPTIVYLGGSAEIAYFAQTAEAYRVLGRPVTPILPRSSLTFIERHIGRVLERYGFKLEDLFAGLEPVLARVVEEHLGAQTAQTFADSEESVNRELDNLKERLTAIDPTLGDALETGRRKINYQLEGLRTRFHRAQMARDEAAHRQLERAFEQLYPHKALQERHVNITSLVARHGRYVIDWIFSAINLESNEHQIVYL